MQFSRDYLDGGEYIVPCNLSSPSFFFFKAERKGLSERLLGKVPVLPGRPQQVLSPCPSSICLGSFALSTSCSLLSAHHEFL